MTIQIHNGKAYFIYRSMVEAGDACARLIHLNPHICSMGGRLNAVVIDLAKLKEMGEA